MFNKKTQPKIDRLKEIYIKIIEARKNNPQIYLWTHRQKRII